MNSFRLKIVSPDGCLFEGDAQLITLRTTQGEVTILANHTEYLAAIGMGRATVVTEAGRRTAACIGGILMAADNKVDVVATTFEWKEDIDADRAVAALKEAEEQLAAGGLDETRRKMIMAKRRRAEVRLAVAEAE
ncbi:MAG: ATP synthase F1 subunit epsilon [Firmicutes bacterium]|nr:ATP synthase F1 subunit epsilon [Bacillota bacterium]